MLRFVFLVHRRLANITILTSNDTSPPSPALNSASWENRHHQAEAYDSVGTIVFRNLVSARQVAIYSQHDEPITLEEFVVIGK